MPSATKQLLQLTRTLHIYFSMLALLLLLFFAMTGFMMNHPEFFKIDETSVQTTTPTIPQSMLHAGPNGAPDERALIDYLRSNCGAKGEVDASGLNDDPIHLVIKGPHHRFDVDISKSDGKATITHTTTSLGGFLGNLHKGSDTGSAWKRIIDGVSILLAFISLTGLTLWISLSKRRTLGLISLAVCLIVCATVLVLFVA